MKKLWFFSIALIITFNSMLLLSFAHGGGVSQLANEPAGPSRVFVWTQPDPPQVGDFHLSLALAEPPAPGADELESGPPIIDATINVELRPLSASAQPVVAEATHKDAANKLFYEADMDFPAPGKWEVVIIVDGPDGPGQTSFELEVESNSGTNWGVIGAVGAILLIVVVLILIKRKPKS